MPTHPFAELEALLQAPHATGVFVTHVQVGTAAEAAGLCMGDIVTQVGEKPLVALSDYYQAMQPQGPDGEERRLTVERRDGSKAGLTVRSGKPGMDVCPVQAGVPAWKQAPDFEEAPDFSALHEGAELALRNSFGEEPAGWERIRISRRGDLIDAEIDFRLGGASESGKTWAHFTYGRSSHRMDRSLSLVRTAFWDGKPGARKLKGDVELGSDGVWRGTHVSLQGQESKVEFKGFATGLLSGYTATLLPLVMPLRAGASLTFTHTPDGNAQPICRERIECTGRETVKVDGKDVNAWCFAWRHYGTRPPEEDEKFYVTDAREMVRIDWGPNYGFCWCEALPKERLGEGVPSHVLVEA